MTEFSEGDLIEATKGDTVVRGRVRDIGQGPFIDAPDLWTLALENEGFTIRTVEKAAPALPTEPGHYLRDGWDCVYTLSPVEQWWYGNSQRRVEEIADNGPLTRLEPVADTAKKVLDRFDAVFNASFISPDDVLKQLRAEFGVTK